jgi:hypothetical protein
MYPKLLKLKKEDMNQNGYCLAIYWFFVAFFLQKPIGIIALLDEAWYNLFALWIGVYLYISLLQIIFSSEFVFNQHVSKIDAPNILNQVVSALLIPH